MIVKKCPNCNAPLAYDEARRVYVCPYCKSELVDENRVREKEEQPEKKVIVEYRHVNVPAEQTPSAAAVEKKKKNPGCSRGLFIGFGIFFVLGAAAEIGDRSNRAGAVIFLLLGIWLLVLGSRRK